MKVGEYIDTYFPTIDGVIMTVHNYARYLNDGTNSCYVATAKATADYVDKSDYEIIRYASIPVPKRSGYRTGIPVLDAEFVVKEHSLKPDVVHAHSPFAAGAEALRMAHHRNIPLVATFHSKFYDDFYKVTGSKVLAEAGVELVVMFFESADYVWTVNNATAATLRDYGYTKDIMIMPNGTDYKVPADIVVARRSVEEKFNIKAEEKVILFVGQQIMQKNIPLIIEAAEIFAKEGKPFKLLFVGEGQDKKKIEEQAAQSSIPDKIIFAGKISDRSFLDAVYTRADVFAFPSIYDNAPLVVREAAAAKTPSILVGGSNAADATRDGFNAYHCENSPESLAKAISRAFADDETRLRIGQAASETISMSWEKISKNVRETYEQIIKDYNSCH